MGKFYRWLACISLSTCLIGAAGCGEGAGNGANGGTDTDVDVRGTPDLNPRTDDDVDVNVENDATAEDDAGITE